MKNARKKKFTLKNKRSLKKSPDLLVVQNSLKNQTVGNFVSFIFYLNVNFRTINIFEDISKKLILSVIFSI